MALVRGEGTFVWDAKGNRYLDFYGAHSVALLGHCPPRVVNAVQEQAEKLLFYSNVAHSPVRAEAATRLTELAPNGLHHVFFANSGSEANETALKLARKCTGRAGVVAMEQGFHGRTLGSLATTYEKTFRAPYQDVLPDTRFVPLNDARPVEAALKEGDVAAVLLEPIQSVAGMRVASQDFVQEVRTLCDEYGALLIFDEVQTGVGRTGTFSMADQLGVTPDLMSLAKSLGSGVPVSAVLVTDDVSATVEQGDHGSTFGGGMLAMAAISATIKTLVEENLMQRAGELHALIVEAVGPLVEDVRGKGCLLGLEVDRPVGPVIDALRANGVLAGPSAHPRVLRLMPPLVTKNEDVHRFSEALASALAETAPACF